MFSLKQRKKTVKVINKNTANTLIFTLRELTTISNPNYLFCFQSLSTKVFYYCIMAELSTNLNRYNEFIFTEGVDLPLSGSLVLEDLGTYNYKVYQQASATNLDPLLSGSMVEYGLMRYTDGALPPTFKEHITLPKTNIVYQPS